MRKSLFALVGAALLTTPFPARAADSVPLTVKTGESRIVQAAGLTRVAVGDGKIAGVVPVGNQQIILNGKSAGRTTLLVWAGGSLHSYDVTVTEQGLVNLRR